MGWFSNLFYNEAIPHAVDQTAKLEPYAAVRAKIVDGAVSQQIAIIRNLLIELPVSSKDKTRYLGNTSSTYYGRNNRSWPHRERVHNLLVLLSSSIAQIDVARADMKTLFRIIDLCNSQLPAKFRELEILVGQKNWSTENQILSEMETALKTLLSEIALLPTTRSILNLELAGNNPDHKNFPNLEPYKDHPELYSALSSLGKDWDKASKLPLSAEDDYVIERVGNSYLPDALLLFDRFCSRTGSSTNEKALSIVKEQVRLIHQQVAFVLEQHEEDSFELMETHTEFLKMKNARIGVSEKKELKLAKEPTEPDL